MQINRELINKSGIYKIESNGVVYIGSSSNLFRRLSDHFRFLKSNTHTNKHIQRHYNKYKEESFSYQIIEFCNIEELNPRETFYIETYECFKKGFNQIKHILIDLDTNDIWEGQSLKDLALVCPLSLATLNRLKIGATGIKIKNKYKIQW